MHIIDVHTVGGSWTMEMLLACSSAFASASGGVVHGRKHRDQTTGHLQRPVKKKKRKLIFVFVCVVFVRQQ